MDPLVSALIVQLILFAISEILPFIKNSPNGIVHSVVEFCQRNPQSIEKTLHETEKCLHAIGQDTPAEILHLVKQAVEILDQPTSQPIPHPGDSTITPTQNTGS